MDVLLLRPEGVRNDVCGVQWQLFYVALACACHLISLFSGDAISSCTPLPCLAGDFCFACAQIAAAGRRSIAGGLAVQARDQAVGVGSRRCAHAAGMLMLTAHTHTHATAAQGGSAEADGVAGRLGRAPRSKHV